MTPKGPDAFRTISEAADELGVPQHVLRFWETRFSFIRPMKRAGGRRLYRRQDIQVLRGVRALLHDEGYTIKGVQRLHKEQGLVRVASAGSDSLDAADLAALQAPEAARGLDEDTRARLKVVLGELEAVRARLDALLVAEAPDLGADPGDCGLPQPDAPL